MTDTGDVSSYVNDSRISFKAKGVMLYMLTKTNVGLSAENLSKASRDGVDSVLSAIEELEAHGYVRRFKRRGDDGMFTWITELSRYGELK